MKKIYHTLQSIILLLCICCFLIPSNILANTNIINKPFEPDLCQNGFAPSWGGACRCFEPNKYTGRYCDEKTNGTPSKQILKPVQTKNGLFILSASLMNHNQTKDFCFSLGNGFRPATRADFFCNTNGIGCLNKDIFIPIKKQFGNRGFFWLEETESNDTAYYADLNDSTVYHTQKTNTATIQGLCIQKD